MHLGGQPTLMHLGEQPALMHLGEQPALMHLSEQPALITRLVIRLPPIQFVWRDSFFGIDLICKIISLLINCIGGNLINQCSLLTEH